MENPVDPLVSIIMPAYNAGHYIADTILSVLNQDHRHFELIIVNDGSTDDTENVISQFLSDRRIRYISQSNMGCSPAKNTGLRIAKGEFIQYLDADDLLSPGKIKEQVRTLVSQPGNIAVCRTRGFYDNITESDSFEIDTNFLYSTDNTLEFLLNLYGINGRNGMIQPNAFLISRKLSDKIGPWDVSISPSPDEDGEYFCRAMLKAEGIRFTESGINYYRKHRSTGNSLSRQLSYLPAKGALRSLQLISAHVLEREDSNRTRSLLARHFANYIYLYSCFKDLCNQARSEIHSLGIQKIPSTGGVNFRRIASLIGFNRALDLKNLMAKKKVIRK